MIIGILSGCFSISQKSSDTALKNQSSVTKNINQPIKGLTSQKSIKEAVAFSAAFKPLKVGSLNENIEFVLWELANSSDMNISTENLSSKPLLNKLVGKYTQLVSSEGVYYIETNNAFGMKLKTECWIKSGKFKKVEQSISKVTICDGKYYYIVKLDEKTAIRYKKDNALVSTEIDIQTSGMLSKLANADYKQEKDQKVDSFDCNVFYMDIEFMGMKGNRLYVDKKTGMLLKNSYGDDKNGMTTLVSDFRVGGFGVEVFKVSSDIKITDY